MASGGYFFGWQFAWFEQREHCPQSLQTGPTIFRHFLQGTMFSRSAKRFKIAFDPIVQGTTMFPMHSSLARHPGRQQHLRPSPLRHDPRGTRVGAALLADAALGVWYLHSRGYAVRLTRRTGQGEITGTIVDPEAAGARTRRIERTK